MFQQIFLLPQVKRSVILSNKLVASRVSERLKTKDLKKLNKNLENLKTSQNYSLVPSLPTKTLKFEKSLISSKKQINFSVKLSHDQTLTVRMKHLEKQFRYLFSLIAFGFDKFYIFIYSLIQFVLLFIRMLENHIRKLYLSIHYKVAIWVEKINGHS